MDAVMKTIIRNGNLAAKARMADAAAREIAKHCDKRIAKMQKALTDIAKECDAAELVHGDVAAHKKMFAAVGKMARRASAQ